MAIPVITPLEGTIDDITPAIRYSPYVPSWWQSSTITRVPETAVGWLVAQGWQVTSTYAEEACGQNFYVMSREGMNSWAILQSLLNEYTFAYNEGRSHNQVRYDDVVAMMSDALTRARTHLDTTGDVSDAHIVIYEDQMDALVAGIESEMATALTDMTDADTTLDTQLSLYLTKLNSLQAIYDTHEETAEAFLTDLGTAELARINELYDSNLAKTLQQLTDRGMSSSAITTAITTRNTRERNEAISLLNDRLAREKLENEHTLYQQEMALNGIVLDGRVKYNNAIMTKAQFLVETRKSIAQVISQVRMARVNGRMDIRDKEEKLMTYQLSAHNELAIALWSFIERREDEYPALESISKLITGLGDTGGGWIQP